MTLDLEVQAFQTPDETVKIVGVVNNGTDDVVRIGTMTSQLYEISATSPSAARYGESMGHLQAPHHLSLPAGESVVFAREYDTESQMREDFEDLRIDVDDYLQEVSCLEPSVDETVTATMQVFIKSDVHETLEETVEFVPSALTVQESEDIIESLREYPLTENSIQMG